MRHFHWFALLPAVAAVAGLVLADEKSDAGAAKTVQGRIVQVQPKGQSFTVRTQDGQTVRMFVDGKSRVRINKSDAELNEYTVGSRVQATYTVRDGQNRVVQAVEWPLTAADVRREVREALEAVKDYTFQNKDEYQRRLEQVLNDLNARAEDLQRRAAQAGEQAREQLRPQLEALRQKSEAVRRQLDKVKAATPDAWSDIKAGVSSAVDELQKAFEKASSRYQK